MSIERRTIGVMFTASALSVANIYYCQPLLSEIGRSFGVADHAIGYLPMWTQAGSALGMFAFVPLGDMFPRRKLIVIMCAATAATVSHDGDGARILHWSTRQGSPLALRVSGRI